MAVAAVSVVVVPAAFAHGGDPTRIHACIVPPQNLLKIVWAPGVSFPGDDPFFDCETQITNGQHWKNLDWSITGPRGASGPSGPSGPRGATGASGATGRAARAVLPGQRVRLEPQAPPVRRAPRAHPARRERPVRTARREQPVRLGLAD